MAETRVGRTITLKTAEGHPVECYESGPTDANRAVLIVHEWWGLKEHNRALADRFGREGFLGLAIDLYDGETTDNAEHAAQLMRELDQELADEKLATALDHLTDAGRPLAIYGCSMGGKLALRAALLNPQAVEAVVAAYCRMETDADKLEALDAPVLAIYAEQESNWPRKQEDFEAAMAAAGKVTEAVCFDAAHGFTNPASSRYDVAAEQAAWSATLDFLGRHL